MFSPNPSILVLLCCTLLGAVGKAGAGEINVAVAANFAETLRAIATNFSAETAHQVTVVSGSTGKHYAQILNGAPVDVFLAADSKRPALLDSQGFAVPGTRFSYAVGRLVVWSPNPDFVDPAGEILMSERFRFMAIANPRVAPYGKAAQEVLEGLNRWEALESKLVRGENVQQALQFVVSGNAELGILARAQFHSGADLPAGSAWEIPATFHEPIVQQGILIKNTEAGREFIEFMRSPATQSLIAERGYDLPEPDTSKF